MACYIFGAGSFYGLISRPQPGDYVIAADGGWKACRQADVVPDLLLGDFDSLEQLPVFDNVRRVPVEKDDTDMMLAVKEGLARGETEFHLYGGMGGRRTDHTIANMQTLLFLARRGARGWLYGDGEVYTAICDDSITFVSRGAGILSVFCMGADAVGVNIQGGQYPLQNAVLTAEFPSDVPEGDEGAVDGDAESVPLVPPSGPPIRSPIPLSASSMIVSASVTASPRAPPSESSAPSTDPSPSRSPSSSPMRPAAPTETANAEAARQSVRTRASILKISDFFMFFRPFFQVRIYCAPRGKIYSFREKLPAEGLLSAFPCKGGLIKAGGGAPPLRTKKFRRHAPSVSNPLRRCTPDPPLASSRGGSG